LRPGRLTVAQVAARLGMHRTTAWRTLREMHEEAGGLLERARGSRTKLWVVEDRLRELMPGYGGEPTGRDLVIIHGRIDRAEVLAERALRRIGRVETALEK
jgi:hypothetical protein